MFFLSKNKEVQQSVQPGKLQVASLCSQSLGWILALPWYQYGFKQEIQAINSKTCTERASWPTLRYRFLKCRGQLVMEKKNFKNSSCCLLYLNSDYLNYKKIKPIK